MKENFFSQARSRRDILRLGTLSVLSTALSCAPSQKTRASRPNILYIMSDDHAYQAISAYGHGLNKTPNIDRIAQEGMLFHNCFVTNSICAPCRAVIISGKYSHVNGVFTNTEPFDGSQQTMPKLLELAGYQTAIVGKWHLKSDPTGFDYWQVLPGQGIYYNPQFLTPEGKKQYPGYVTEIITDLTVNWLKNMRDPSKPFLLMCHNKAPHRNWEPGPKHMTTYDTAKFPEPETLFDDYSHRASPARNQKMEIGRDMTLDTDLKMNFIPRGLTEEQEKIWKTTYDPKYKEFKKLNPKGKDLIRWKYQRYLQDYLACIADVDDNVGRLLEYLDASDLAENTIVVYSSDQGFYLGEHGWFDKRWIYEESLRTPLMVRWPGKIKPGSVDEHMVLNLDIPETFLDAAGVSIPQDMQGKSFYPLLLGQEPKDWRSSFYYHYYEDFVHGVARHYGIRTQQHVLAHFYMTDEWELFDLQKDPHELKSVYNDPAYEQVQKELKQELDRLRKELKVPDPDPEDKIQKPK